MIDSLIHSSRLERCLVVLGKVTRFLPVARIALRPLGVVAQNLGLSHGALPDLCQDGGGGGGRDVCRLFSR